MTHIDKKKGVAWQHFCSLNFQDTQETQNKYLENNLIIITSLVAIKSKSIQNFPCKKISMNINQFQCDIIV